MSIYYRINESGHCIYHSGTPASMTIGWVEITSWLEWDTTPSRGRFVYIDNYAEFKAPSQSQYLFAGCLNTTLASFIPDSSGGPYCDMSDVSSASYMFYNCPNLETLDFTGSNFGANGRAQETIGMFEGCPNLSTIVFDDTFDFSRVIMCGNMFSGCTSLTKLDIKSFKLPNHIYNMDGMFDGCTNLEEITAWLGTDWNTTTVDSSANMFRGCTKLPNFNSNELTVERANTRVNIGYFTPYFDQENIFFKQEGDNDVYYCNLQKEGYQVVGHWNAGWQPASTYIYDPPWAGRVIHFELLDGRFIFPPNCVNIFQFCSNTTFDTTGWEMDRITDAGRMFYHCESLVSLDLTGLGFNNVENFYHCFSGNKSLETLDLRGVDVSKCTNFDNMFSIGRGQPLDIIVYDGTDWQEEAPSATSTEMFLGRTNIRNWDGVDDISRANTEWYFGPMKLWLQGKVYILM